MHTAFSFNVLKLNHSAGLDDFYVKSIAVKKSFIKSLNPSAIPLPRLKAPAGFGCGSLFLSFWRFHHFWGRRDRKVCFYPEITD